jgi:hypothetical protein
MSSALCRLGRCLPPVLAAVVLAALAAPPAEAQNDVFDDSFESGDTGAWSSTEPPLLQNCNCYFSNDCTGGHFCFWGPAGPFTEDICGWRVPKPNGTPGVGCDADHDGPWGAICDGYCTPTSAGSPVGWEDPTLVAEAVRLWGEAMLAPAAAGGGPIDPERHHQNCPASPIRGRQSQQETQSQLLRPRSGRASQKQVHCFRSFSRGPRWLKSSTRCGDPCAVPK